MPPPSAQALPTRFFDAIEAGDVDAALACYAESAVVWHNTDEATQSKVENARTLSGLIRATVRRRYVDRRLSTFDGGFVQQHVLEAEFHDGRIARLPAVIVCAVSHGRITRLDEYFDGDAARRFSGH